MKDAAREGQYLCALSKRFVETGGRKVCCCESIQVTGGEGLDVGGRPGGQSQESEEGELSGR